MPSSIAIALSLALIGLFALLAWLARSRMSSREEALVAALAESERRRMRAEDKAAELKELVNVAYEGMSGAAVVLHGSARTATQSRSNMETFLRWALRLTSQVELLGEIQDTGASQGHELPRLVDIGQVLTMASYNTQYRSDVQVVIGSPVALEVMAPSMALASAIQWLFDHAMADGKARQIRATLDKVGGNAHLSIWAGGASVPHNLQSLLAVHVLRRMGAKVLMATPPGHYLTIVFPLATSSVPADAGAPSGYGSLTEQFQ